MKKITLFCSIFLSLFLISCDNDDDKNNGRDNVVSDDFDRAEMLKNWADNIIIPSYESLSAKNKTLKASADSFSENINVEKLDALREAYKEANIAYQKASVANIGKAEEIYYHDYINIYPTNASKIDENITNNIFDLTLPSRRDQQGFPALDYLLYGVADTDDAIVVKYTSNSNYVKYLKAVIERIDMLTDEVLNDWKSGYRDTFVANTSSSSTGAVDMFGNDFVIHYEKDVRSDKLGTPLGIFTGELHLNKIESLYNPDFSRTLLVTALEASRDFYLGVHFNDSSKKGPSFASYLEHLNTKKGGKSLSKTIEEQYNKAIEAAKGLEPSIATSINNDQIKARGVYDKLQQNVVYLKSDMLSALSIKIDYVDSDGD